MPNASDAVRYDVAVIGAGIAGAAIARDAALRGLRAVVFEKKTAGWATSSRSSKLIHGGLRYLEIAWHSFKKGRLADGWKNLRFVWHSLRECNTLQKIASQWIEPLPILIPIYRHNKRPRVTVVLGVWLYFLLALAAGGGHRPEVFWNARATLRRVPGLRRDGLLGGILYWDRVTNDLELTRATLRSARQAGAALIEHTRVTGWSYDPVSRNYTLETEHRGKKERYEVRKIVNATGPWMDQVAGSGAKKCGPLITPIAGCHLEVKKFLPVSVLLEAPDGRVFFVINLKDKARIGTTERNCPDPDTVAPTDEEIEYLLEAVRKTFPAVRLFKEAILSQDAGVRPLAHDPDESSANALSREHRIVRDAQGVYHAVGVKLTDHRRAAEEVLDKLSKELEKEGRGRKKKTTTHQKPLSLP